MGSNVTRAHISPSVLESLGKITGVLVAILVEKACPNRPFYLVVDPDQHATITLVTKKDIDVYGRCSLTRKVPKKAEAMAKVFLENKVYRQEGYISDRNDFTNFYLQYRGGRKPPDCMDMYQPGIYYIYIY